MKIILSWFPAIMLGLGALVGVITGNTLSWILFFAVGVIGVWAFFGHAFRSQQVAASIGWQTSPFQFEVAVANLGLGVAGVLAPWHSTDYAIAITIVGSCFLWGAAWGHVREMIVNKNFAINNAGPIFWTDILIPLTLWISILR